MIEQHYINKYFNGHRLTRYENLPYSYYIAYDKNDNILGVVSSDNGNYRPTSILNPYIDGNSLTRKVYLNGYTPSSVTRIGTRSDNMSASWDFCSTNAISSYVNQTSALRYSFNISATDPNIFKNLVLETGFFDYNLYLKRISDNTFPNCLSSHYTFHNCSNLEYIGSGVLNKCKVLSNTFTEYNSNTNLIRCDSTFDGAEVLDSTFNNFPVTSFPDNSFNNVTSVNDPLWRTKLVKVPKNSFNKLTSGLKFPSTITEAPPADFMPELRDCKQMFASCTAMTGYAMPFIQSHSANIQYPNCSACFYNCTALSDYNEIPARWKTWYV